MNERKLESIFFKPRLCYQHPIQPLCYITHPVHQHIRSTTEQTTHTTQQYSHCFWQNIKEMTRNADLKEVLYTLTAFTVIGIWNTQMCLSVIACSCLWFMETFLSHLMRLKRLIIRAEKLFMGWIVLKVKLIFKCIGLPSMFMCSSDDQLSFRNALLSNSYDSEIAGMMETDKNDSRLN